MRSKELRAQRAKLIEDARALISVDAPTAEQTARFDEMMAEETRRSTTAPSRRCPSFWGPSCKNSPTSSTDAAPGATT